MRDFLEMLGCGLILAGGALTAMFMMLLFTPYPWIILVIYLCFR